MTTTPTAPLSSAGRTAMRRLELALSLPVPPAVVRAITQFETAAVHARDLAAVAAAGRMSDLDADSLAAAEDVMAASREMLAAADWLAAGYLRGLARHGEHDAWITHGRLLADLIGLTGDTWARRQQLPDAARAVVAAIGQMETVEVAS